MATYKPLYLPLRLYDQYGVKRSQGPTALLNVMAGKRADGSPKSAATPWEEAQAANKARENEIRAGRTEAYDRILGTYTGGSAGARASEASTLSARRSARSAVLAGLKNAGEGARMDINQRFDAERGGIPTQMAARGLGATTIGASLQAGLEGQRARALAASADDFAFRKAALQASLDSELYGAADRYSANAEDAAYRAAMLDRTLTEDRLGFIERIEDEYPVQYTRGGVRAPSASRPGSGGGGARPARGMAGSFGGMSGNMMGSFGAPRRNLGARF